MLRAIKKNIKNKEKPPAHNVFIFLEGEAKKARGLKKISPEKKNGFEEKNGQDGCD